LDLTNPANGIHAVNLIVYKIAEALQVSDYPEPTIWRSHPITTVANNYDRLYVPPKACPDRLNIHATSTTVGF
jgi:phenylalanyl-tRNA synthetase alpha chain